MAGRVAEIAGKGRGWVAARAVRGGEVVVRESPILLYDAGSEEDVGKHCGKCFRGSQGLIECPGGCNRVFCGPQCSHSGLACTWLSVLRRRAARLSAEQVVQARFLVAAYCLVAGDLERLMGLQGSGDATTESAAREVVSVMAVEGWSVEVASDLLAKDNLNAFGLMDCFSLSGQKRGVRAYGIYGEASLFNHDCLPNACRFDYLLGNDNELVIRAIHDIAEGSEICLSYFPVNLDYKTRQARLTTDYGFTCNCDRCQVESAWDNEEEDDDDDSNDDDAIMEKEDDDDDDSNDDDAIMENDDDSNDDDAEEDPSVFPHAYFFARYMCQRPNCGGTLAPLQQQQSPQQLLTMECNVCSNLSSLHN